MSVRSPILAALSALAILVLPAAAHAEDPPAPAPFRPDFTFGFRGVGEIWQDPAIVQSYRSSRFAGAGFASLGIIRPLAIEAELGYMRQSSAAGRTLQEDDVPKKLLLTDDAGNLVQDATYAIAGGSMELMPVTFSLLLRKELGGAQVFAGPGFAMAVFNEQTDVGAVSGVKPALDLKAGARIHTRLIQPPIRPVGPKPLQGLDVELLLGRRQHHAFGVGQGFDFSAWRIGIGLAARL
jgi:hypothetical protein